jgi:hypothetical protein
VLGVNVKLARVTVTSDVPADAGGVEDELVAAAAGLPPLLVQPPATSAIIAADARTTEYRHRRIPDLP